MIYCGYSRTGYLVGRVLGSGYHTHSAHGPRPGDLTAIEMARSVAPHTAIRARTTVRVSAGSSRPFSAGPAGGLVYIEMSCRVELGRYCRERERERESTPPELYKLQHMCRPLTSIPTAAINIRNTSKAGCIYRPPEPTTCGSVANAELASYLFIYSFNGERTPACTVYRALYRAPVSVGTAPLCPQLVPYSRGGRSHATQRDERSRPAVTPSR